MNGNVAIVPPLTLRTSKDYTLEQYLTREERSSEKHEFFDGKIVKMPNAKFRHNLIATNVSFAIKLALRSQPTRYLVVGDGQKIYIPAENVAIYPDGIVICEQPVYYDNQEYLITNPLVVIEVLSRSTQAFDRSGKFDLYKSLPSFKEYLLIDSRKYAVETRFKVSEELWRMRPITNKLHSITLESLGITLALEDIYDNIEFANLKKM
jgi:Uma2 family endonuclease